jgi:hypothetical protein
MCSFRKATCQSIQSSNEELTLWPSYSLLVLVKLGGFGGRQSSVILLLLSVALLIMPFTAAAEILDYDCVVDDLKLSLHIDTQTKTVRQTAQSTSVTEVGEYSDGVYGPISHAGAAALIPSVHQFVRITEELISYGAELKGVEDEAVLNRRLATITLPTGRGGWCSQRG